MTETVYSVTEKLKEVIEEYALEKLDRDTLQGLNVSQYFKDVAADKVSAREAFIDALMAEINITLKEIRYKVVPI